MNAFEPTESFARDLDCRDPLAAYRDRFHIPTRPNGEQAIYFCGNSLGLQPKAARDAVLVELDDWAALAVDAHFEGRNPWYPYHEFLREPAARLVGARPREVVIMNGLTVNLHLLMVSFFSPTPQRHKILIEDAAFPSDTYAVRTQLAFHGFNPDDALVLLKPRPGEQLMRTEDIESLLAEQGQQIALALLPGVNYLTGQALDLPRLTAAAHAAGCVIGVDLAHAAGNLPLALHDWNVDFAAWCSYKYLNSGPGAVAGCFIHERHVTNPDLPRFGGWWGNDPKTRFRMHLEPEFVPVASADAWQLSNPPILAMAPVLASLKIFDEVGMPALRAKSLQLTGYLRFLIDQLAGDGSATSDATRHRYQIITPREPDQHGCQLSFLVHDRPRELRERLQKEGVVCDFREPNILRAAPTPLYNTFHEVWRFAQILSRHAQAG